MLVGDFNVEPTKNPLPGKRDFGSDSGLILRRLGLLLLGCSLLQFVSAVGLLLVVIVGTIFVGCPLAAAAVLSCRVQPGRWVAPHLAVRTLFDCSSWGCRVTQLVHRTHLWPAFLAACY